MNVCSQEYIQKNERDSTLRRTGVSRYRRCTFRFNPDLARHLRQLAARKGWQIADLARTLICLGGAINFGALWEPDRLEELKDASALRLVIIRLSTVLKEPVPRPYGPRTLKRGIALESKPVTVHLPESLVRLIQLYASVQDMSRNQACDQLLMHGIILYLKAENALLQTTRSVQEVSEEGRVDHETSSPRNERRALLDD